MNDVEIKGYVPGAIGRITELHALYYNVEWGFGAEFEAGIAKGLSDLLCRCNKNRDRLWTVVMNGRVEGSIAIDSRDAETDGAYLRWFLLSSKLHGRGLGNRLLTEAVSFCRKNAYSRIYLWTFEGLQASRHLYRKFGFSLEQEREGTQWGKKMIEQKLVLDLYQVVPGNNKP